MESVTGRDGYIIAKALRWALKYAETLPDHEREWSDEEDMKAVLEEKYSLANFIIHTSETFSSECHKVARDFPNESEEEILKRVAASLSSGRISGASHGADSSKAAAI